MPESREPAAPQPGDARLEAVRYRLRREAESRGEEVEQEANAGQPSMDQRAHVIENAIQQAIRRGDFDDLPGAGKPLPGLTGTHDPDWWIRRKIERENLTGLGPPALTLRTEDAEFAERVDRLASERAVREQVEDFNRRVREARRQLLGGPPVVTPTRDPDAEVAAWQERRRLRLQRAEEQRRAEAETESSRSRREWWRRGRQRGRQ